MYKEVYCATTGNGLTFTSNIWKCLQRLEVGIFKKVTCGRKFGLKMKAKVGKNPQPWAIFKYVPWANVGVKP